MIQRVVFEELLKDIANKEISLIIGPRQAGKTTAMRWLEDHVRQKGIRTVFLNLDIEADQPFSKKSYFNKKRKMVEAYSECKYCG